MIVAEFLGLDIAPAVGAALVAAGAGVLLAALRALALVVSGAQERRRELYSEAYKAAMAWREMVYRVRRRTDGDEAARALIDRFHELQERIDFYEGWIASESRAMGRSFCRLVKAIKTKTEAPLRVAWEELDRRMPAQGVRDDDDHPDVRQERDAFLTDVRQHLSLLLYPKVAVAWRNRKGQKELGS